jgi:hypothetical protein
VDRTQPNKVHKAQFTDGGEWFFRQTVIDVPATSGVSFIGEQGTTERVVWDIQEQFLFAYRSYAFQEGGDGHVRPGTGAYTDNPVAAYRIISHFDVQRAYNAATGEQTNVIVENMSDRPWYEREYMRIDWGNNLISDFQFGAAAVRQQPVTFFNGEDPTHPTKDQAVISDNYIDVVQNITAQPELNQLYTQYFGFPILECWLYSNIHQDCLGAQIKVRSSFMRAPEVNDYQTLDFDDVRFAKFGYFRAERYGYNPEYGVVEPAVARMANRFSIWTDAESCYDPTAAKPYASCSADQLKPIVYYLNEDFPNGDNDEFDLRTYALDNAEEWNRVFKQAVLDGTGWSEDALDGVRMYTICANNPVQEGDPAECGAPGTNPQMGDLRYSMYYYVRDAQEYSPLGYGPSAQDPLTGETIQGNAFYYGAPGKWLAARTRDIIKLDLGLLELDDLSGGAPAAEAARRVKARGDSRFRELNENFDKDRIAELVDDLRLREKAVRLQSQIDSGEALIDQRAGRLDRLDDVSIDEDIMSGIANSEFMGIGLGEEFADGASNFQGMRDMKKILSPDLFRLARYREDRLLHPEAGGCILTGEEFFDIGLVGLGNVVKREFYNMNTDPPTLKEGKTEDDLLAFLMGRTMADTQLHEIGHTVGLRHNFAGSTDALNFGENYWRLRGPGYTMGTSDVRPRPLWDLSGPFIEGYNQALREGLVDLQDSSVMDYASTYGTNNTLGMYDKAAIKFAYLDVVEVFNTPEVDRERADLLRPGALHYTYYPELLSNAGTYEERVAAMYDRGNVNWRFTDPRETEHYDENLVEVPYVFCSDEYRDASAICATWDAGLDNYERTWKKAQDYRSYHVYNGYKRNRVSFGVDVFSYLSRIYNRNYVYMLNQYKNWVNDELIVRRDQPCVWYENGQRMEDADRFVADACGLAGFLGAAEALNLFSEVIQTPDVGCYAKLKPGCYMADPSNDFGIDGTPVTLVDSDPAACVNVQPVDGEDVDPLVPLAITTVTPYRLLTETEEMSASCADMDPIVDSQTGDTLSEQFVGMEYGDGRSSITRYDRETFGYYFYWKPTVMGSWWDKWLAVKAIGDPYTDFIGVDANSDTRSFMISFQTLFGDQINDMIGGIINEEAGKYGAVINPNSGEIDFIDALALSTQFDREANTTLPYIDPDQQYTFRLLAMFNAAFQQQQTDDLNFQQTLLVGATYELSDIDMPADIKADPERFQSFRDPETGLLYWAVKQDREAQGGGEVYSSGFEFVKKIKDKYYFGGVNGDGTAPKDGFLDWQLQGEIRILDIMRTTGAVFGNPSVWSGDLGI